MKEAAGARRDVGGEKQRSQHSIFSPHQIIPVSLHSVFSEQETDFSLFPSVAIIG